MKLLKSDKCNHILGYEDFSGEGNIISVFCFDEYLLKSYTFDFFNYCPYCGQNNREYLKKRGIDII